MVSARDEPIHFDCGLRSGADPVILFTSFNIMTKFFFHNIHKTNLYISSEGLRVMCGYEEAHLKVSDAQPSIEPALNLHGIDGACYAHVHKGVGDYCHLVLHFGVWMQQLVTN